MTTESAAIESREITLGKHLRLLRTIRQLPLEAAALAIGKSKSMLSMIESGKRSASLGDIFEILRFYQCEPEVFFLSLFEYCEMHNSEIYDVKSKKIFLLGNFRNSQKSFAMHKPIAESGQLICEIKIPKFDVLQDVPIRFNSQAIGVVLSGKLLIEFVNDELLAKPETQFFYNANQVHKLRNYSDDNLHVVIAMPMRERTTQ